MNVRRAVAFGVLLALACGVARGGLSMQDLMASLQNQHDGPNCDYKCADGTVPAKDKAGHVASANGCGTDFLSLQGEGERLGLTECCNAHDRCYGSCGSTFQACEEAFSECMGRACDAKFGSAGSDSKALSECKSAAAMFSMGTRMGGCAVYRETQRGACDCGAHGGPGASQRRAANKGRKRARGARRKSGGAGGATLEPREEL